MEALGGREPQGPSSLGHGVVSSRRENTPRCRGRVAHLEAEMVDRHSFLFSLGFLFVFFFLI